MTIQKVINRYSELLSKPSPRNVRDQSEIEELKVRLQRLEQLKMPEVHQWGLDIYHAFETLLHRIEALEAEVDILRHAKEIEDESD